MIQIFVVKLHTSRCKPNPSNNPVIVTKEVRNGLFINADSVSKNNDEKNFANTFSMAKVADTKTQNANGGLRK